MSRTRVLPSAALFALSCADVQHDALMDLHKSTNGDGWSQKDGWGVRDDYCTWFGVTCDHDPPGTSQVTSVSLSSNNLNGTIPDSIADIEFLKTISLDGNSLTGPVPKHLAKLPQLQMVNLQHNALTGTLPATMINLTVALPTMQQIDLSYNKLTGPIPETMFGPEKLAPFAPVDGLKVLNLRYNQITGNIPTRISHAKKIVSILLGGNKMDGVIAKDLGPWLDGAKYCDLSGNSWQCPLPKGVADKCQAVCK